MRVSVSAIVGAFVTASGKYITEASVSVGENVSAGASVGENVCVSMSARESASAGWQGGRGRGSG